ncbi:MAG: T9SS type A sorting domain-containing protein, partial [Bacteroidota bacterium]|nr:T9SS type A sorting domain-containing protein [Bacteroidota bacterium]
LTLPLISISAGDNVLDPQTNYYAGVECYSNGNNIYLGADSEGPHLLHLASNLRLGATWYWIHTLPLVRLNLSGTDVLPFITSTPIYDVDFLDAYSYTVTTYDPQGLPVTLSATASSPDISMQAVDNGDGTMSISTPVISTTSFGDDDFTISITVDNGIASNYQQFMVQVANVFQVEDISKTETLIFPNPVKHTLYCRNPENAIIQIYSLTGSLVYLNKSAGSNKSIDMSLFNEGTYFIKIIDGNNVVINKLAHIK